LDKGHFSIQIEIDSSWIAAVYDHVHHGRILSLFEQSRAALVEAVGFPNEVLMGQGKVIVVTRVEADYKREVRAGPVEVTCDAASIEGRTIKLHQRILNEKGKVAVDARVCLMFMDASTRRGMDIPREFAAALSARLPD
jgi:YbgC/YbaW family acyl-CoA thioester hydrolase